MLMCPCARSPMLGTLQAAICKSMQMCRSDMQRGIIFNAFQFYLCIFVHICSLFNQVRFTWLEWPEADSVAFAFVFGVLECSFLFCGGGGGSGGAGGQSLPFFFFLLFCQRQSLPCTSRVGFSLTKSSFCRRSIAMVLCNTRLPWPAASDSW